MKEVRQFVKLSIFIFGSFSFGWVFGIVLHELGHAIAMWVTGGIVDRITIAPFSWSYTYYESTPKYPQLTTWSGVLIGAAIGLIVLLGIRKNTTPYLIPFIFLGFSPLLNGGGYYIVDTFISNQGDAFSLLQSGVPKYVVLGVGLLLLAMGVYVVIINVHRVGITPKDTFIQRAVLFGSGILPYFMMKTIYAIIKNPKGVPDAVAAIIIVFFIVVLVSWAAPKYLNQGKIPETIEWYHAIYATLLGVSAIVVPQMIFAS